MQDLERQADGEVQREVALEAGINDGEVLLGGGVGRIYCLHAAVETQDEVVEVETNAQTVGNGQLPPEGIEAELPARLFRIFADGPNVAGIDKCGSVNLPEYVGTIFQIQVQLHVARLVDKVDAPVLALERTGAETAHRPAAHAVGTATEVTFLVRQNGAVAEGEGYA